MLELMPIMHFFSIKEKLLNLPEGKIFAAENKQNKTNVIIKISTNQLSNEYDLAKRLDSKYIRVSGYQKIEEFCVIEMPDNNSIPLSNMMTKEGVDPINFFKISKE